MQELIAILIGMKAELSACTDEPFKPVLIKNFDRCIELAREKPENKEQKIARLEGKIEAYENTLEAIARKF